MTPRKTAGSGRTTRQLGERGGGPATVRRWLTALVVLAGMAGAGMVAAAPAASAATATCQVVDTSSDQSYPGLQAAVDAAAAGDTLLVKGTCARGTDIGKNLTISGQSASGTKTATLTLTGGSSVLIIDKGVSVTLNTLVITNGSAFDGGGIQDEGSVTLNGSTVTGNTAAGEGGGIFSVGGTVTMNDGSTVTGNTATRGGGGIFNGVTNDCGTLVGTVAGVNVDNNTPDDIVNGC